MIHVEPSQAAFFAGETFSAKITFTNTNRPSTSGSSNLDQRYLVEKHGIPTRPATAIGVSLKHKRAAHSITYGSLPMAQPPTSPGTPNYYSSQFSASSPSLAGPLTATPSMGSTKPSVVLNRKGLVGHSARGLLPANGIPANGFPFGSQVAQRLKAHPRRSLSVDVQPVLRKSPPSPTITQFESSAYTCQYPPSFLQGESSTHLI